MAVVAVVAVVAVEEGRGHEFARKNLELHQGQTQMRTQGRITNSPACPCGCAGRFAVVLLGNDGGCMKTIS